jgi:hypothetical protein
MVQIAAAENRKPIAFRTFMTVLSFGSTSSDRDRSAVARVNISWLARQHHVSGRDNDGNPLANQIGCQYRQPVELVLSPAKFDEQIPALDIAN